MANKVLIFSAPSGSGKSTVVNHILGRRSDIEFSVSATSRPPRGEEQDGVEYFFYAADIFRLLVRDDKFVEYEEVYPDRFYGTLKSHLVEGPCHHLRRGCQGRCQPQEVLR